MNAVKALLFDLGGVVINIDFDRVLRHWATISALSFAELKSTFHFDTAYQRHERGEIDAAEYFDHLRKTLALEGSDDEIAIGWNAIFVAEIPTVLEAINQVRSLRPCYALKSDYPAIFKSFDRIFISSDLGLRKPELRAFAAIADQIGTTCREILFFDDTLENIEGAKQAGLQTVHVRSPADIQQALSLLAPTTAC